MPLEEIRRKAQQFEKRIARRNLREYIGAAVGAAIFTYYMFTFHSPMIRTGCALIIAGLLAIVVQLHKRAAPGKMPADLALTGCIAFHRRELARQRDLLRTVWLWYVGPIVPGIVVFGMGAAPRQGTVSVLNAVPFFSILGIVMWLNYRAAKCLDRQIAELDNLEH